MSVDLAFATPLVVSSSALSALNLEFDLANPAFIVGHTPPAAMGATLWAVNFHGPVRHRPVHDIAALVLRHTYGTVTGVAADGSSLTISKDFPVLPVTNPETARGQLADAAGSGRQHQRHDLLRRRRADAHGRA